MSDPGQPVSDKSVDTTFVVTTGTPKGARGSARLGIDTAVLPLHGLAVDFGAPSGRVR